MAKTAKRQASGSSRFWWWGVRALLGVATAVSVYLAWAGGSSGGVAGCGPDSGCASVLTSRWAYWLGLPVGMVGVVIYGSLLGLTFRLREDAHTDRAKARWVWAGGLSGIVIGAAIWFAAVQTWIVEAFCLYCLTAHGAGSLASLGVVLRGPWPRLAPDRSAKRGRASPRLSRGHVFQGLFLSGAGLLLLIGGQAAVGWPEQGARIVGLGNTRSSERTLEIHDGESRLDLNEVPLWGPADAPHILVSLFDYTCKHCRTMHHHLKEARRTFPEKLAIVSLPMPLDADCNRLMNRTPDAHRLACEYARLGLAVWRADPAAFERFDDRLFEPPRPPPLEKARAMAAELVGRQALRDALNEDWVEEQIKRDVDLYEKNYQRIEDGRMPQLIVGSQISVGELSDVDELYALFEKEFGLQSSSE